MWRFRETLSRCMKYDIEVTRNVQVRNGEIIVRNAISLYHRNKVLVCADFNIVHHK